jgi:hypothetical protein
MPVVICESDSFIEEEMEKMLIQVGDSSESENSTYASSEDDRMSGTEQSI